MDDICCPTCGRPLDAFTEPRPLKTWADLFGKTTRTMGEWFRTGNVRARKIGREWAVQICELPYEVEKEIRGS